MSSSPVELNSGRDVAAIGGQLGERREHIELGDGASRAAKTRRLRRDDGANFDKKPAFDFEDALVGGKNFALVFLQLWRSEALGVYEGLLALEIGGREMEIGLRDLHVVSKNLN